MVKTAQKDRQRSSERLAGYLATLDKQVADWVVSGPSETQPALQRGSAFLSSMGRPAMTDACAINSFVGLFFFESPFVKCPLGKESKLVGPTRMACRVVIRNGGKRCLR